MRGRETLAQQRYLGVVLTTMTMALTTPAISAANTTGTAVSGCKVGYAAAGSAITYSFGYSSGAGNGAYDIAVYAEFLG